MALAKFIDSDGKAVWVNPRQVTFVRESVTGVQIVVVGSNPPTIEVDGTIDNVVHQLNLYGRNA